MCKDHELTPKKFDIDKTQRWSNIYTTFNLLRVRKMHLLEWIEPLRSSETHGVFKKFLKKLLINFLALIMRLLFYFLIVYFKLLDSLQGIGHIPIYVHFSWHGGEILSMLENTTNASLNGIGKKVNLMMLYFVWKDIIKCLQWWWKW